MRIEARSLSFAWPRGPRAVREVSLAIAPGECLALIGPNGAGKSTLLGLLAGRLRPDQGQVLLDGRPIAELGREERARRIALVPQGLRSIADISVARFVEGGRYSHLGFWRRAGPADAAAVRAALAAADVDDLGDRLLSEISGGQRQRVLVARALAQEAPALFVDEPTSSLDPRHQIELLELVARLAREGRSVLLITHELNLASRFATRIALMQDGRIAADGPVEDVLREEVLEPVYGPYLRLGRWPEDEGGGSRPFVVPWSPDAATARPDEAGSVAW